ncbi:MAG: TonB-dependent receptor [Sphingobium sp.]
MKKLSVLGALLASAALVPGAVMGQTRDEEERRQRDARTDGQREAQPSGQSGRSQYNDFDDEEIIVAGQRPRGSVVGDIQPELTYNAGDVRALGVSDISELVSELAPQLTSGRGGQPIVLLEGRRVSSFREIATIPTEAIQRVEILPEEVALKYGYPADQKVMNVILRRRFRAFTLEAQDRFSTDGGANKAAGELGFLTIRRGGRFNLNVEYDRQSMLLESDRGITNNGADTQRSLVPSERQLTVTGTYAKPLSQKINASINGEVTTDQTIGLTGASGAGGLIPDGTLYSLDALARSASGQTARLGATINADGKVWHSTLTTTYTHDESRTLTDGRYNDSGIAAALAVRNPADVARSRSDVMTADLTSNASLYRLPAGDVSLTLRLGGTLSGFEAERTNYSRTEGSVYRASDLNRSIGLGAVSLDVPLVRSPSPFIGRLSANGNAEVQSLSDFGTIKGYGFGLNWRPRTGVAFIASYKSAETAPTVQQLGNPQIVTGNVQVFDYQTGQTVNITQISGGNPNLQVADQKDFRIGTTIKPFSKPDVTLTVDYNHRLTRNGVGSLPGTTDAAEQAFGSRFVRDAATNELLSIDARSVNIARQESSSIRWGLNFTKTLKTPQSQIDAMRAAMQRQFPNGFPGRPGGPGGPGGEDREGGPRPDGGPGGEGGNQGGGNSGSGSSGGSGASAFGGGGAGGGAGSGGSSGGARGGFGGPGGPGGGFGGGPRGPGGMGGRINFAVYHTVNLNSTVTLRDGLPEVDLLNGGTLGERAGQPRHEVELQGGYSQSGIGMRLTGKWQSATRVVGSTSGTGTASSDLRFSDLATFNIRLFANLGQRPELVKSMPWLRGARIQIGVNNIFNSRQKVTDATGATPLAYRPGLIDPQGRTIQITLRKQLF